MRVSVLSCCLAVMAAGGLASARTASFRRAGAHTQAGMKIECEARIEVPAVCFPPHAKCEGPLYKYKIDTGVDQKLRDLCSRVCQCVDDPTKKQPKAVQFADELCEMGGHHGLENYEPENKVLLSEKPPVTKAPVRKLPVNKSGKSWLDLDDRE